MKMVIMVGVPGSGKSTLAKKLAEELEAVIISTDSIFESQKYTSMEVDLMKGTTSISCVSPLYFFVPEFIGQAHKINQAKARAALSQGVNVVIDNTNLTEWERQPYLKMAEEAGYEVEVVEPDTPWKDDPIECFKRNTHGVPLENVVRMIARKEL